MIRFVNIKEDAIWKFVYYFIPSVNCNNIGLYKIVFVTKVYALLILKCIILNVNLSRKFIYFIAFSSFLLRVIVP